jgi:hypothetical protein
MTRVVNPEYAVKGGEPDGHSIDYTSDDYNINLIRALNWYSNDKDKKDATKYIRDYVKLNMPSQLKVYDKVDEKDIICTQGWVARIINTGANLSPEHKFNFNMFVEKLLVEKIKPKSVITTDTPVSVRPSIQESIKDNAKEYIAELEGKLDEYLVTNVPIILYNDLKANQTPQPYIPYIRDWATGKMLQMLDVMNSDDPQLLEGYSYLGKRQLKAYVKMLETFVEDCNKYQQFKKANRKPRVIKEKPAGIQVKAVQYQLKDEELGLQSVAPSNLVGATQAWLFNTKTRKLAVYRADDAKGFSVKGTTLQNYLPEQSSQKTLRKPAESIPMLMAASKIQLRKFMDTLTSKSGEVNGRINSDTIILRVIK